MKTKNILLGVCFSAYLILYYQQTAGLNHLLFSVIFITALLFSDASFVRNKPWILVAVGAIVSGLGVTLYGNDLSYIANLIAISSLAGLSYSPDSSLIFASVQGVFSYVSSPMQKFIKISNKLFILSIMRRKPFDLRDELVLKNGLPWVTSSRMCKYIRMRKWLVTACVEAFDKMLLKEATAFRPSIFEAFSGFGKSRITIATAGSLMCIVLARRVSTLNSQSEILIRCNRFGITVVTRTPSFRLLELNGMRASAI